MYLIQVLRIEVGINKDNFVFLQLGIRDVFEPRQRDFTLMTRQSGVYVRSIEQAVSVAIRKYRPDDQKKNSKST